MLTHIEYLLLSEMLLTKKQLQVTERLEELVNGYLTIKESADNIKVKEALSSNRLKDLRIKMISEEEELVGYLLEDQWQNNYYVIIARNNLRKVVNQMICEKLVEAIHHNEIEGKLVVTGVGIGGLYAMHIAASLKTEGIVFGAPTTGEIEGEIKNYIVENAAISEDSSNLVFVKQKPNTEILADSYLNLLLFDEEGNVIEGEQSDYSKYTSWVYNTVSTINHDIWKMFFKETPDGLTQEKDLYTILLRTEELQEEGIKASIKETIRYTQKQLEKNVKSLNFNLGDATTEFEDLPIEEGINNLAVELSNRSTEIVEDVFNSVQTIMMGIQLATIGKNNFNVEEMMENFASQIDELLDGETERIGNLLEIERDQFLETYFAFPDFTIEE